jgi:predicted deacylase
MDNKSIFIAGNEVLPGTITNVTIPSADLYTQTKMNIPVRIIHGKKKGPTVFITGTIHGDEINSVEIIRRLHLYKALKKLRGTLITIPVVNVYGFLSQSRYLPDRRDLNRSFPGSEHGSLAARLAHILLTEVIKKCHYGIDLHTGAYGRMNMPQLRVNLDTPGAKDMARAFNVPVILDAKIRDGSLRGEASDLGIPVLVYEGGEALRYNELSIRAGVLGIINVLSHLNMIDLAKQKMKCKYKPVITQTSRWVRAITSGLLQPQKDITEVVRKGDILGMIHDPFLVNPSHAIIAPFDGIVIGRVNLPLVNEGDGAYHIASIKKLKSMKAYIDEISDIVIHTQDAGPGKKLG